MTGGVGKGHRSFWVAKACGKNRIAVKRRKETQKNDKKMVREGARSRGDVPKTGLMDWWIPGWLDGEIRRALECIRVHLQWIHRKGAENARACEP